MERKTEFSESTLSLRIVTDRMGERRGGGRSRSATSSVRLRLTRGVMIPFFSGTGIITGITEKELESESHGIGSKVESIPGLESIPRLESIPYVESAPVHKQG